jgi:hypothetical protein
MQTVFNKSQQNLSLLHKNRVTTRGNPQKGREAATPSNIKEIQEIQGGQEAPHDGDAINPKDA